MSNYLPKLLRFLRENPDKIPEGGLSQIKILHDDDCALMLGVGTCDCDPEIGEVEDLEDGGG